MVFFCLLQQRLQSEPMTKISPEFEDQILTEGVLSVSADVSFISNGFPKYKLGPNNQILEEPKENNDGPTLKEVVERETTHLSEQHKRLSVRDLASKFDKNLAAAAKLTEEVSNFFIYFCTQFDLQHGPVQQP